MAVGRRPRNRTGLTSSKIRHVVSHRAVRGVPPTSEILGPQKIARHAVSAAARKKACLAEKRALEALRERRPDDNDFEGADDHDFGFGLLDGSEMVDISHAGGEFHELTREVLGDFWNLNTSSRSHRHDFRTRRDRTRRRTDAFDKQMSALREAYMAWHLANGDDSRGFFACYKRMSPHEEAAGVNYNQYRAEKLPLVILPTDTFVASALVHQGIILCSPISPTTGLTMQAAYVKTICDLQGVQFRTYLSRQFSIAYDVYLQILANVNTLVHAAIGRHDPDWRLKHACPACTYKLANELPLKFRMLYTKDGNDSLKRVLKQRIEDIDIDSDDTQRSCELPTMQLVGGDRYLSRDFVDSFAGEAPVDLLADDEEDNPNMKDEKTRKMWGVFDESGIFMAVCRHGFSLVIADMVQSGEQAKYPLAVVSKLLDAFGTDLGGGYDIGCRFKTTLSRSVLGQRARELNHTSLVGAFHGHAHQRLCQLDHLATYVDGLGLEDLEGCERTFSKSNALASSVRYASVFHRHQAIAHYFEHNDDYEVYANLSTFLYNNYKQALHIISDGTNSLPKLMRELGVEDESVFDTWLAEERAYLTSTIQMEYWQKLVNLSGSKKDLDAATAAWSVTTPSTVEFRPRDIASMNRIETTRRHAIENYEKDLNAVQELETKLGVTRRWVQEDQEWKDVGRLVANRKFQRALDHLEGLVVARIFELSKMNQAGTGYKLRKHIGKALQVWSAAIRTALDRYNTAARALCPPHPSLSWEEVVEYAFLSDFDLLHDARQDISQHPWATPTGRLTMDTFFKMRRAHEEIQHLDIEIRRLATYLHDKSQYLTECEKQLQTSHPGLARQVSLHRKIRARFAGHHYQRLQDISMLEGFTGSITPGESVERGPGASASSPMVCIPAQLVPDALSMVHGGEDDALEELEDDENADTDGEEHARVLESILQVTLDV
ncbi:hypothetical protein DFJ58DRAFT_717000 [Suillus subalutaceus]|uniref:uncharacterized protein n=1 Tax=Suillus subalutaceus TaxID=48586 RepID=UPI001B85F3E7|nr:uncharacterized protein DFJ58DRAFT_717000 [Suillus subalutaceus]KAG1848953.1 hypothetical protein DFJ58DRAFT_717000 [Suillus subalutaceus]